MNINRNHGIFGMLVLVQYELINTHYADMITDTKMLEINKLDQKHLFESYENFIETEKLEYKMLYDRKLLSFYRAKKRGLLVVKPTLNCINYHNLLWYIPEYTEKKKGKKRGAKRTGYQKAV